MIVLDFLSYRQPSQAWENLQRWCVEQSRLTLGMSADAPLCHPLNDQANAAGTNKLAMLLLALTTAAGFNPLDLGRRAPTCNLLTANTLGQAPDLKRHIQILEHPQTLKYVSHGALTLFMRRRCSTAMLFAAKRRKRAVPVKIKSELVEEFAPREQRTIGTCTVHRKGDLLLLEVDDQPEYIMSEWDLLLGCATGVHRSIAEMAGEALMSTDQLPEGDGRVLILGFGGGAMAGHLLLRSQADRDVRRETSGSMRLLTCCDFVISNLCVEL